MEPWPKTRVTLLGRLSNPRDKDAWDEFVALYGPFIFKFARRRLPQEEDAADITQEVLSAVLKGTYQRPKGRFQKWLLTVLLNAIRDFHAARGRRYEVFCEAGRALRVDEESAARRKNGSRSGGSTCSMPPPGMSRSRRTRPTGASSSRPHWIIKAVRTSQGSWAYR